MKNRFPIPSLGILTAAMLLPGNVSSDTLTAGQSVIMASEKHDSATRNSVTYNISLNDSNPGFAGFMNDRIGSPNPANDTPFQVKFREKIQGYRFVNASPKNVLNTVVSSGVSISMRTSDTKFDSFNSSVPRIWTSTDPKADLLNPVGKADVANVGIRDINHVDGSIDISGLASGTVYFFYGAYNNAPSIIACMIHSEIDGENVDVVDFHNGDHADFNERYMSCITFVNDGSYDSIEYDLAAVNGRWDGIVVAGKPFP